MRKDMLVYSTNYIHYIHYTYHTPFSSPFLYVMYRVLVSCNVAVGIGSGLALGMGGVGAVPLPGMPSAGVHAPMAPSGVARGRDADTDGLLRTYPRSGAPSTTASHTYPV